MRWFIRFCEKIKYLGLLGLPGLFLDYRLFDFFWLFWLFGFVGIFYNFPVFLQSLKQLWGMLYVPLHYGSHFPNKSNYCCKVKYSLPFTGTWTVVNGGVDKKFSHSWNIPAQRYAYDFLILNENGKSFTGDAEKLAAYHCYDRDILAPADGQVIEIGSRCPESLILGNGRVDCSARDIRGNYILIRHGESEYSLLAHLKPGSISVKAGEVVRSGQKIARCGNSGNSSEPHLHFQLQNGISFYSSAGLPIEFEAISAEPAPNYSVFDPRPLPLTEGLPECYITRGYNVRNL
ncbi:M23 family metallopeptidase [Anaerocolumna sp. MB42-C2]|uniref:M23 family metallopeptidase n=1 Tax=Anaerocolumna sp. MB42-C2 TaxID=3070997 RepID=UPI0027E12AC0|nr:M23 family metallopeptidase [Anaerocolumna sp. MB42-C2]WMJ85645.1 M23 family metallopeptidase [Anaerocolumna sp. MB42-C2]